MESIWPELRAGRPEDIDAAAVARYTVGSLNGWVIRTYFHMLRRGLDVKISTHPDPNRINIVSPRDFGRRQRGIEPFILVPRADGHRPRLANFWLEQNELNPPGSQHDNVPYWPQAGIRRRDVMRRDRVERISFKGRHLNLDPSFHSSAFIETLKGLGVDLEIDAFTGLLGENTWWDYKESDVVMAVRNLTQFDASVKPASKLINAWFGEVAAILGPEPAYRALRRSEYDYIEVRSTSEAIEAIRFLKANPIFFRRMIENGRKRREAFTEDAVLDRWIALINGPVGARFQRWQRTSFAIKLAWCSFAFLLEPASKAFYRYAIHNGPRLLDSTVQK